MQKFSPELSKTASKSPDGKPRWRVILYNDHMHKLVDVARWLMESAKLEEAFALKVCKTCHEQGRAVCYQGEKSECQGVVTFLRSKGLQVELDDY